jgi:glycine/D-amino acid oxidase-like deaminating enzyme
MEVDYIIVGQGIGGTLLAYLLRKRGASVMVVDRPQPDAASLVAAGTINPITGRKYVKSWMIDDLIPAAKEIYGQISADYGIEACRPVNILRVLTTAEEENTWLSKSADPQVGHYIVEPPDASQCEGRLSDAMAYGELKGCLQVRMVEILTAVRNDVRQTDSLREETFDYDQLHITDSGVTYQGIAASACIFAEGHAVRYNPYFSTIKWQPVKGEVLRIRIPGAPFTKVVRHRIFITHLQDDLYWVGARYIHNFVDAEPTADERAYLVAELDKVLDIPYEVVDHQAGIRPAVSGRRPVVGPHPMHPRLYLFNGLGTKGASLAPYFASQLVDHLLDDEPLDEAVTKLLIRMLD